MQETNLFGCPTTRFGADAENLDTAGLTCTLYRSCLAGQAIALLMSEAAWW